jgi:SH3 domain protein
VRPTAPLLLSLCAALSTPVPLWAETSYVTDHLEVTLRAGESTRFKILKMLPSGTPLTVIAVNPKTKYAQVKTTDGTVGFVPAEQLQAEPAARARAAELDKRLAELQENPDSLAARLARAQAEQAQLQTRYQDLEREKQRLEQENATIRRACANVLDVTNDRERLRVQVADLTRTRADLEQENRDLRNQSSQRWFLIGAAVLGGGILLGLILPRLRLGRRKSAWGSL